MSTYLVETRYASYVEPIVVRANDVADAIEKALCAVVRGRTSVDRVVKLA